MEKQAFISKKEVAEILNVSPRMVDYMVSSQTIPYYKIGKRTVRINKAEFNEWMERNHRPTE